MRKRNWERRAGFEAWGEEELDAEKVEHAGAEREAIERFGPVESVAGELVAEYGLRETRRTISILAVVIAVFLGFSMLSSGGPLLTGHVGALLDTAVVNG